MLALEKQNGKAKPEVTASATAPICLSVGDKSGFIPPPFLVDQKTGKRHFRSACKARGVADNHTAENAYLLIPEDAAHGHILKCSHPTCFYTGREFRYCAVCRQAVAKRNFHRRHNHGLIVYDKDGRPILPEEDETSPSILVSSNSSASRPFAEVTSSSSDDVPPPSKRARTVLSFDNKKNDEASQYQHGHTINTGVAATALKGYLISDDSDISVDDGETSSSHDSRCSLLSQEEMGWLKLFRERPRECSSIDPTKLMTWFSSVMGMAFAPEKQNDVISGLPCTGANDDRTNEFEDIVVLGEELDGLDSIADFDNLFEEEDQEPVQTVEEKWNFASV